MLKVKIKLYGPYKDMVKQGFIVVTVPSGCDLSQLRDYVHDELNKYDFHPKLADLIRSSVFAGENLVIGEELCIDKDIELAILPPVSGG